MKHYIARILLSTAALTYASAAYCQTAPVDTAEPSANDPVAEDASGTDGTEIVVTARKRAENLQDVPDAITVFTEEAIVDAGIQSVADFAALTPGISFREQFFPGAANLTVRGIPTQQNGELPVALAVDGVTVPFTSFLNQDLLDVQQIEVLKGPQGGLYGRNSIAGAINITTRRPNNDFQGRVEAGYGNGDSKRLFGTVSGPIVEDRIFAGGGISLRDSDGLIRSSLNNAKVDGHEEITAFGRIIVDASDNFSIDLRSRYTDADSGAAYFAVVPLARIDDFSRDTDPIISNPAINHRKLWEATAKLDLETDFGTFTSISGYFYVRDKLFGETDFGVFGPPEQVQDFRTTVKGFSQELKITSRDDQPFRWILGAFYQDRKTSSSVNLLEDLGNGQTAPFVFLFDERETSKSWAAYGQANYDITQALELTLALRYDQDKRTGFDVRFPATTFQSATFKKAQPKVSLAYKLSNDFLVYGSFATGFRSGGFNDITSAAAFRVYDPETSQNFEVGAKSTLADGAVTLNASAFQINFKNQQFFFFVNQTTSLISNADKTRIKGFELELAARPVDGLTITAGAAYIDAKIVKNTPDAFGEDFVGNTSPGSNEYTLNAAIQYVHPLGGDLELLGRASYERRGPIFYEFNNLQRSTPKDIVDLRASLRTEQWSLSGFVNNLTNERYPLTAESFLGPNVVFRLPSRPRTYGVEASFRF